MQDIDMTTEELLCELRELRSQIDGLDSALKLSKSYESIFREMIDREGEAVFVVQDGRIKFANPAYAKLTGYKLDETLVHNVIESLVHPDDREMVSQYHTRRLQGDTLNFHYNFRIICKQGFQKWVEMNSSLIMWDGKAAALCFANDITERKEAQESMKDSHDLIKVIIDSLPVGLLYLDSLERIVFANKKFGAWWGKPGVNLSGHMVDNILGDDYTEIRNRLRTALAGQEIFHEAQVRGKDGATREMVISYAPHIVGNGQVKGVACLIQDITPLKQVERELRKNKERLEIALEAGAVGLWDWDLKTGRPVGGKWTTRMRQTLGFEAEPWPDIRSWKSAVHPDDWQMVSKALNDHLTGQVPFFEAEFRMRGVSDEWKYYLSRGKVVEYDIEGKPLRITGTTADVTERMRAEREFRKSEEKYRHLIETAYDVVYTMDLNGHVTFVNPACLQHIGYYPEEITGKNYLDFIPEEYKNQIRRFYCSQVEKKLPNTSYEFPIIAKNGKMRWFVQNTQLLMKEGTVVGFQAIARDITDRKQMEEALRQSEKRYRDLTEFLPQAVFEVDATMRPTFVNSACVELTGYSSEELLSGVNPLMLIISEDRARMAEDFQKVMQGQTILMTEYTGLRKDGPTVPVLGSAAPIYENERIVGIRGVISDISALRQAEEEKMALQNQLFLSQKMEALGTLVGGIAHDFNNMLQIIIGYCEMILAEKKVDQPHFYRHLQTIIKTGKGGAELVQKLLAFGQQTQTVPVPLDLNHHISQLSALMSRTLPHVVKLTLDLTDKPTTILASHGMIDQVVMNLAINASEAMPKGGGLNISTTIVTLDGQNHKSRLEPRPGKYVRLTVKDSGQGMDEQTLLRIFDPFFSTKERGATGGTGLGLSVVSGIVQQLGGHITCRSKLGEGTEFKVLLPVIEDSDEIPESVDPVTPVEGKGTILVVEDILEVVELEKMGLESAGYRVMVATSGKEALEIYGLRNKEISLVILDLIMPEMPGRDCLMELIKIDPTVKVLIASGYSPEDDLLREINPLVRGFIHKPFSMTGLQDKVRFALDDIN